MGYLTDEEWAEFQAIPDQGYSHRAWVDARIKEHRIRALEEAADKLVWKPPDRSPCEHPDLCCGSEASCEAMQKMTQVVGEDWLRAEAQRTKEAP